jgi:hypothetical protein
MQEEPEKLEPEKTKPSKTIVAMDSQWFTVIQTCPQKMKMEFIDHLRPGVKAEALEKGDLVHQSLAEYYRNRQDKGTHAAGLERAIVKARIISSEMDLSLDIVEEAIFQVKECLEFHRGDGWIPLEIERPFSKVFFEDEEIKIISTGIIDLIADIPNIGPTVIDHKSSKRSTNYGILGNQFSNYAWATGVSRVIVNQIGFQKTLKPAERFKRYQMNFAAAWLKEWSEEIVYWVKLGVWYQKQDFYPHNWSSCNNFGGCIFKRICETTPDAREWKKSVEFVEGVAWDPYSK